MIASAMPSLEAAPPSPPPLDWTPALTACARRLRAIPAALETDYLALGGHLQRFHDHTVKLSKSAGNVSSTLSDETMRQEVDGLRAIIEQTTCLQQESRQSAVSISALLDELVDTRLHLAAFTNISRHLHALCNVIKIETARLGNAAGNFSSLASEVGALVADIEDRRTELWEQSENLILLLRVSVRQVAQIEARQTSSTARIIKETEKKLLAVHQHRGEMARSLSRIAAQWDSISVDIGGVVVSLQSHDSTRQRLEHAAEALVAVLGEIRRGNSASDRLVLQACRLQEAQIESAGHEAINAGQRMGVSLLSLATAVRAIAGEGASNEQSKKRSDDDSFGSDLEKSLLAIRSATLELEELNQNLAHALSQVARPVKSMSSLLDDVARVGGTLRLLGLNACVHACHVGTEGAALSLLAEDVHRVSLETSEKIQAVSSRLERTIALASRISTDSAMKESLGAGGAADLRRRVDTMITEVTPRIREASGLLERMKREATSLAKEITDTAATVRGSRRLAHGLESVLELMDRIVEVAEQRATDHLASPDEGWSASP